MKMKPKQKKISPRKVVLVLGILFSIGVVTYMFANNGLSLYKLEKQKIEILQAIENEKIRSNQLDQQVEQIGTKSYVEYIARKYLGLYYPDETIVIPVIEEDKPESEG